MPHDLPPTPTSSIMVPTTAQLEAKLATASAASANVIPILTPPITPPKSASASPSSGSPIIAPAALMPNCPRPFAPCYGLGLALGRCPAPRVAASTLPQIHHTPDTLYTRIHGKWYDLRDFRSRHPGGPFALSMVAGRDGTVLFESYHPFSPVAKMQAFLRKYEVAADIGRRLRTIEEDTPGMPRVDNLFDWPEGGSEFANELKGALREYFEQEATRRGVTFREATKGTPKRHAELLLVATAFVGTVYLMAVRTWWPAMFLCPLTAWVFAANVFHDASHFALTVNPNGNFFAAYLFPYFTSPTTWALQHIIGHHAYPNVAHLDPDVAHTRHARRDHPKMDWNPAHEWQGLWYRLAPHWLLATTFGLNIANEVDNVITGAYNDAVPVGPRSLSRHLIHLSGRALTHQVVTAQNFGPKSAFHFWMSGGLNHQIEHHLFPD
ncbi:hypothetical protein BCR44DRAFT_1457413 [Catenaria anguillulae PL171]|uniref:Cytochrome b5 heme-binding domain-containing protein n=1 Tax=Catenaria anguillulae PL171 TaxID=765915 RepID=A0A1Y2I3V9_9FUNG|nr:hypothetical protein BCR44DRAFT_1457413 [Catenaria anguillulae PL171]